MPKLSIPAGTTSKRVALFIQDSSSTTGAGLTGLAFNSAGLTCYSWIDTDGNAGGTSQALQTATLGTWTTRGFIQKDSTNLPGYYEFGIPDALLAAGVKWANIMFKGATNQAPLVLEIEVTAVSNQDAVRGGMTALPNANAGAAGGLMVLGVNATATSFTAGLTISNAGGDALVLSSGGSNGNGLAASGNGTGAGIKGTGGATGNGLQAVGGATSGSAIKATGTAGNAIALELAGQGLAAGLSSTGGATSGNGASITGGGTGHGAVFTSGSGATGDAVQMTAGSTNGRGLNVNSSGSGSGISVAGGTTGNGLFLIGGSSSGTGITVNGNGNSNAISVVGGGTGHGVLFQAGASGADGLRCVGSGGGNGLNTISAGGTAIGASGAGGLNISSTAADAIVVAGTGGHGINVTASGVSKHGMLITGGTSGTSDGVKFVAGSGGVDFRANQTGNLTGNVSGTVGSVTGAVGSVTGAVGSVTGNVGGNVTGTVASVIDISTTSLAESAAVPAASATPLAKLNFMATVARNKITQTATTQLVRNDADAGTIATSTVSDDGTTFTRNKFT